MKKLFSIIACGIMIMGLSACGNQSNHENGDKTNKSEKTETSTTKELEKVGFEMVCKDTDQNFACGYKNKKTSAAFVYNDDVGLSYQSKKNSYLSLDNTDMSQGEESKEEIEKEYNDVLKRSNVSINDIRKTLKKEFSENVKKSAYYRDSHKGYEAGTYAIGKDLDPGEYLVLMNNGVNTTSVEIRKNEYTNGDDHLYDNDNFYNDYIIVYDGQFVETDGVTLYKISDSPKVPSNYNIITLKVGRDIEAGNYIITPTDPSVSYYEVTTKDINEYGTLGELITNDLNFSSPKKVTLSDGQYIKLSYATIDK